MKNVCNSYAKTSNLHFMKYWKRKLCLNTWTELTFPCNRNVSYNERYCTVLVSSRLHQLKVIDINAVEDTKQFIFVGYCYGTSTCVWKKIPGSNHTGVGQTFFHGVTFREAIFWGILFLGAIFQRAIFRVENISKIIF